MKNQENVYSQLQKNTVAADNQLKETDYVHFYNLGGTGKRIMFMGNSITLHGILPEIGWHWNWGMAASAEENDYVHRLMTSISQLEYDPVFCICQVSKWECNYKEGEAIYQLWENARKFNADIIVMRFVENAPVNDGEEVIFKEQMLKFLRYFDPEVKAKIILTTGFFHHPAENAIAEAAEETGWPLVELSDLGEKDEMKAIGLFEHSGVAVHPGDLGMKMIADRIFAVLKQYLK